MNILEHYLNTVQKNFQNIRKTAEKAIYQLSDHKIFTSPQEGSNSISIIIQHMAGNMVSRWSDFFTSDGEKSDRDRDSEFTNLSHTREELINIWNNGWTIFLNTLNALSSDDLHRIVQIRGEAHCFASD